MRAATLLCLLLGAARPFITKDCVFYFPEQHAVFDFGAFRARAKDVLDTKEGKIVFKICGRVAPPKECVNAPPPAGGYLLNAKNQCTPILAASSLLDDVGFSGEGAKTKFWRQSLGSDFTFEFLCRPDLADPLYTVRGSTVVVETRSACKRPPSHSIVLRTASIVALAVAMALGLFLAFLGGYLWSKILVFVGFVFGAGGAAAVLLALVATEEAPVPWYAFVLFYLLCMLCGIACAYLFVLNAMAATLLAGFAAGFAVSVGAATLFGSSRHWIALCCHLTLALTCGFLCLYFINVILAVATSAVGALLFTTALHVMLNQCFTLPAALGFLERKGSAVPAVYPVVFLAVLVPGLAFQLYAVHKARARPRSVVGPIEVHS